MNKIRTIITHTNNDWVDIKNECRNTINKDPTPNIPNSDFKHKLLISEHSPIRLLDIKWAWNNIKSWIATHWVRHHIGVEKWVSTQRDDRTNVDRNKSQQDTPVNIHMKANAQALINIARYRLCNQAHKETREYMLDLKHSIHAVEPELADVLVPNCIYRCGCPEFNECGFWSKFLQDNRLATAELINIKIRYKIYNEYITKRGD